MRSVAVDSPCPMCRSLGTVTLLTTTVNVPYFGDGLETTMRCEACGFRHADFMIMDQREPVRLTFRAKEEPDLSVRVIRSNSGTIRIPEIGFNAEPTPLSESFVSNVEGVLERAKDVLLTAVELHREDAEKRALLGVYLQRLEDFMNARAPFTLIIDDPFGNSAIVSETVARRALTEEELSALKTGMIVLDKADLETAREPAVDEA